jgi:ribonuclease E
MSRQRIRSSVLESSTEKCPHCGGLGHVRSVASVALHLLRMIEEMLMKGATHNLLVRTRSEVALYVLNHKRAHLRDLEDRFRITITVNADAAIGGAQPFVIEKGEQVHTVEAARALAVQPTSVAPPPEEAAEVDEYEDEEIAEADASEARHREAADEREDREGREDGGRRRRRRRRRGRRGEREPGEAMAESGGEHRVEHGEDFEGEPQGEGEGAEAAEGAEGGFRAREGQNGREAQNGDSERRRRRRGRRGGRRHREGREGGPPEDARPEIEPEVADAVADFGGPPPVSQPGYEQPTFEAGYEPQQNEPTEPRHEEPVEARREEPTAAPPSFEPPAPETPAPRRRSTVREAAPIFGATPAPVPTVMTPAEPPAEPPASEPAPQPAEATPSEADPAQPARRGWWRRR